MKFKSILILLLVSAVSIIVVGNQNVSATDILEPSMLHFVDDTSEYYDSEYVFDSSETSIYGSSNYPVKIDHIAKSYSQMYENIEDLEICGTSIVKDAFRNEAYQGFNICMYDEFLVSVLVSRHLKEKLILL